MKLGTQTTTLFLLVGLAVTGQAVSANDNGHDSVKKTGKKMSSSSFVTEAARGGMAEVELGKLALVRAQDPDIREFAQRMVDDHSRANAELKQLAQSKNWKLPTGLTTKQQMTYNSLHDKAGTDFDREYAKLMMKDHDHDVKMFEKYSEHGADADLKSFASNTLPTLRDHQEMARSNADKLGVSVSENMDHDSYHKDTMVRK